MIFDVPTPPVSVSIFWLNLLLCGDPLTHSNDADRCGTSENGQWTETFLRQVTMKGEGGETTWTKENEKGEATSNRWVENRKDSKGNGETKRNSSRVPLNGHWIDLIFLPGLKYLPHLIGSIEDERSPIAHSTQSSRLNVSFSWFSHLAVAYLDVVSEPCWYCCMCVCVCMWCRVMVWWWLIVSYASGLGLGERAKCVQTRNIERYQLAQTKQPTPQTRTILARYRLKNFSTPKVHVWFVFVCFLPQWSAFGLTREKTIRSDNIHRPLSLGDRIYTILQLKRINIPSSWPWTIKR